MPFAPKHEFFKTFCFRLTLLHILLVSVALAATFAVALFMVNSFATASGRKHLASALKQMQSAYLDDKIPAEVVQLPEDLLAQIETQFPGIHIGLVEREKQPGGWMFEVIGSTGLEWMEILAEPSGQVWVADRKPLQEVFDWMVDSLHEDGMWDVDLFILSKEGTMLAGVPSSKPSPAALASILHEELFLNEPVILKEGESWVGATLLYDGNILYLANKPGETVHITRYGTELFLVIMVLFIPLSGGVGFYTARRAMAGVTRVTRAVGRVKEGDFSERVQVRSEGSEIEELVDAFNEMVSRIEVLMREMREVTVNIAHDLRSPIARIRGLLESMNWEEIPPEERDQMAGAALEECDRIAPLIDSVLELAQAETGMLVLQKEPFNLSDEVRAAHAMFSTLAEDRHIQFECTLPEQAVEMVGDRLRMQRVIANLLDNALKFAPESGSVSVVLERDEQQATVTVQDNGPGIPPADLDRVFERFYRADRSRSAPGNGLGLSLVKAFVKALGGTATIHSSPGAGCNVAITVPLDSTG